MSDRSNWERERMRDRGNEGNRENWTGGREEWRDRDWDREQGYTTAEERNRPWGREGRYGSQGEEWNRGRQRGEGYGEGRQRYDEYRGGYGGGEGRSNEGRGWGSEYQGSRGYEGQRGYEGSSERWQQGGEGNRQGYGGREGSQGYGGRGSYGPSEFTRHFGNPDYFGTGQRGFGTNWGGSGTGGYGGWGGTSGYSGGMGSYGEQGRYAGRGPKGYQRSDERIREDVCERLAQHPEIDAGEIEIQVKSGEVTLTGTVNRREEKRMAEDVAESVSGAKDVHNQLRVQSQSEMAGQGTQSGQSKRESGTHQTK